MRYLLLLGGLFLFLAGCPTPRSARTIERDAGAGRDAGTMTGDSGMTGRDSGMAGEDAGTGMDAGGRDAGTMRPDAGRPDAGCMTPADCSDGLACNGTERCVGGACMPGTAIVCNDGIACTRDTCSEPAGTCVSTPDASLCTMGMSCDPVRGCVAGCTDSPCRLLAPQCGCGAGMGCYVSATGRECRAAGTVADGALCTGTTGCRPGSECVGISTSATVTVDICKPYCAGDAGCAGGLCVYDLVDSMDRPIPGARVCTNPCNPARGTGCPAMSTCDLLQESMGAMRIFTDCRAPVGSRTQGVPCTAASDCAAGYTCLDPDGAGTRGTECMHWCEVSTGTGCLAGDSCLGFMTPIVVSGVEYGVCD
jgi:hypothetical protein